MVHALCVMESKGKKHTQNRLYLLLFHGNNVCANSPECYFYTYTTPLVQHKNTGSTYILQFNLDDVLFSVQQIRKLYYSVFFFTLSTIFTIITFDFFSLTF